MRGGGGVIKVLFLEESFCSFTSELSGSLPWFSVWDSPDCVKKILNTSAGLNSRSLEHRVGPVLCSY